MPVDLIDKDTIRMECDDCGKVLTVYEPDDGRTIVTEGNDWCCEEDDPDHIYCPECSEKRGLHR